MHFIHVASAFKEDTLRRNLKVSVAVNRAIRARETMLLKPVFVCLVILLIFAAIGKAELVPSISAVSQVRLVNSSSTTQFIANARLYGDIAYFYQETPSFVYTLNVTQLQTSDASVSFTNFNLNSPFAIGTAALVGSANAFYLGAGDTVYKYVLGQTEPVSSVVAEEFFLPATSFLYQPNPDNVDSTFLYMPWTALQYGETSRKVYKIELARFQEGFANSTTTIEIPGTQVVRAVASGSPLSEYHFIIKSETETSTRIDVFDASTDSVTKSFVIKDFIIDLDASKVRDIGVVDEPHWFYLCGVDPTNFEYPQPFLLRIDFGAAVNTTGGIENNEVLTIPIEDRTVINGSAIELGPDDFLRAAWILASNENQVWGCNALALDIASGTAFAALWDGQTAALVPRVNVKTMRSIYDAMDVFFFNTNRQTPAALLIQPEQRFLYVVLEQSVYSFYYPTACPLDCKFSEGHGTCVNGQCQCSEGWVGDDCNEKACDSDCGQPEGRGVCGNGICYCTAYWTGASCEERRCPNDCNKRGICDNSTFTCQCEDVWVGEDCTIPTFMVCNASTTAESCVSVVGCGWCADNNECRSGNVDGPSDGSCHEWHVTHYRELGTMIVAIIAIVIFGLMLINNFISAMVVDYQTASLINDVNPLTVEFLKATFWRDERSSKSWMFFDQMQFIGYYIFFGTAFPTRLVNFCRLFGWAAFLLPLPFYVSETNHPERNIGDVSKRSLLNVAQVANSLRLDPEQLFYSVLFWFMIAFFVSVILYGIFALIFWACIRRKEPNIGTVVIQKFFYVGTRIISLAYVPICITAAYHLKTFTNEKAAASAITLLVIGIGFPLFNGFVIWGKTKELLFIYLKLRFGHFYTQYNYTKAKFNLVVWARKFLISILIGFLIPSSSDESDPMGYAQVIICVVLFILYSISVIAVRPFLDTLHTGIEVIVMVFNTIAVGIVLTHKDSTGPSATGEIVALVCMLLSLAMCCVAYCHSWYMMNSQEGPDRTSPCILCHGVPSGGPVQEEEMAKNWQQPQRKAAPNTESSDSLDSPRKAGEEDNEEEGEEEEEGEGEGEEGEGEEEEEGEGEGGEEEEESGEEDHSGEASGSASGSGSSGSDD